ncbi:hypothetical protein RB653_004811 [Dictyostelium firmibasis]|uniref:Uncharacterized protein n=1 Tax=Dictyostelium firmibasis TaxID=79012 RepID=A0AAN7Z3M3_9MYCE
MSDELLSLPTLSPTTTTTTQTTTLSSNEKLKLNQIFQSYKPICDELITILSNTDEKKFEKEDNKKIIINLEYLIQSLIDITEDQKNDNNNTNWSLTFIFDYLMIPISLIINSTDKGTNNNNDTNNNINNSNNIKSTGGLSLQNHKVLFCIRKESIQLKSFTLLSKLLDKIKITQFKKFVNILTIIINYLNQEQQQQQQLNEEILKLLLLNIRLLFKCTQDSFFNDKQLYPKHPFLIGDQFVPFGYTISTLLNLLTQQQQPSTTITSTLSREIKKELIFTLDFIIEPFSKRNLEYFNILFQIFPGTISSLFKIISGDYKLGSVLKVQCLDLFSKIISTTLSDNVKDCILSSPYTNSSNSSTSNSSISNAKNEQINSMFKESELNLYNMFCLIYPTSNSYSGLRVQHSLYSKDNASTLLASKLSLEKYQNREALARSSFTILLNCSNLTSLSPILLEVLVLFHADHYPQIQNQTNQYFIQLKEKQQKQQNQLDIDSILQDNFNHLFQSLPMLICNSVDSDDNGSDRIGKNYINTQIDEEKKIIVFKLVLSYINILGDDISSFFSTRIDMIASTLISLSEMQSPPPSSIPIESTSSKNLQKSLEDSLKIISDNPFEKNQKRSIKSFSNLSLPFINFNSRDSENYLIKVIELIGKICDIREWIDILISNSLLSSSPKRKEIIFCLNHLLIGNNNNKNTMVMMDFSTVQYILEEIMSPNLLNLVISRDQHLMYSNRNNSSSDNTLLSISNKENDNQLEIYFDNTVTISLVLESIGVLTKIVGNFQTKKFRQIFLSKIIYQLLEKLGLSSLENGSGGSGTYNNNNNNGLIIKQCTKTLNEIQISFGYESIQDIIYKNSDYLLDTIESHMKYLDSFPNTPSIFEGILNITGLGFLPFLSDTIRMILNSLDLAIENSKNIQIFISILSNIVKVLYNNSKHQLQYQQILLKLNELKEKRKLNEEVNVNVEEEKEEEKEKQSIQDIKEFFLSHHSKKDDKIEQLNQLDIKNNSLKKQQQDFDLLKIEATPESLGIPNFIETTEIQRQMVQEIIRKSIHFIGSKNKIIKMATIDIVEMGLVIVATGTRKYGGAEEEEPDDQKEIINEDDHEHQQQQQPNKTNSDKSIEKVALFPLIHLVWDSLVRRVSESDRIIAKKSLEVIQTISNLSLEFISQRFWDQLWPIINRILIDEQSNQIKQQQQQKQPLNINNNNNNNNINTTTSKKPLIVEIDSSIKTIEENIEIKLKKDKLKYTPSFKVQFICLQTLKTILLGSAGNRIKQNQIMDIAKTTIYYLNRNQPEQFQHFTMDIWKDVLLKNDPDSLWLLLFNLSNQFNNEIYHFQQPLDHSSTSQLIRPIPNNFQYSSKEIIEFKSNALILFNLIN